MSLDPKLLEILRCPADQGELDVDEAAAKLTCRTCGRKFAILDGDIPDMLLENAEQ